MADAGRIRNSAWQHDEQLKNDLQKYVARNLSRKEILHFAAHDYPLYAWSLGTLARRLAFFYIKYMRYDTNVEDVENAILKGRNGRPWSTTSVSSNAS
jgi:hypothetical protein